MAREHYAADLKHLDTLYRYLDSELQKLADWPDYFRNSLADVNAFDELTLGDFRFIARMLDVYARGELETAVTAENDRRRADA